MIQSITFNGTNGSSFNLNELGSSPLFNFDSSVDYRTDETLKVQDHGLWPTFSYLGSRTLTFEGDLLGTSAGDLFNKRRAIFGACVPTPELGNREVGTLVIDYTGMPETVAIDVYLDGYPSIPINNEVPLKCPYMISFKAFSPFFYGTTINTIHLGAPGTFGGRTYNKTYNKTYAASSGSGGQQSFHVGGDAPSQPIVTLYGQMSAPTVSLVKDDIFYSLKFPELQISTGDQVIIDLAEHTILNSAGGSLYDQLDPTSTWWRLYPGSNKVTVTAASADAASDATVDWKNVYLPS